MELAATVVEHDQWLLSNGQKLMAEIRDNTALNDNHVRALSATFSHLDEELADLEARLREGPSPLSRNAINLTPEQIAIVLDHIARIRERLASGGTTLGLRLGNRIPITNTLNAVLALAQVSLADSSPQRLRGYGLLGAEAAQRIATVLADVDRAISRLTAFLARPDSSDLAGRIAKLGSDASRRDLLAQIERIVTRHGVVELRPAIAAIVELLEAGTFEVAVFGRVSSGKSSLINAVIGAELLPVGATPVTAVPTRVRWGPQLGAYVQYAGGSTERVEITRLQELVTEAGNPENRRGLVRVTAEAPAAVLGGKLVLVDTPGVGSLASHGAREAYTYLPRCDLGVLLIEAASAVSREDVDLLRRLDESGIDARVVLAKADLVPAAERERVRAYFARELEHALGHAILVDLVSTAKGEAALAKRWFAERILPLGARGNEVVVASASRKLAALHASVLAILRAAAERAKAPATPAIHQIEALALASEATLRELAVHAEAAIDKLDEAADAAIRAAAHAIHHAKDADPRSLLADAIRAEADAQRHALELDLVSARTKLRETVAAIAKVAPVVSDTEIHVDLVSQPVLEIPPAVLAAELDGSRWPGAERRLAARIDSEAGDAIRTAFDDLRRALRAWSETALVKLGEQVSARIEPARAYARVATTPAADVAADLEALERM